MSGVSEQRTREMSDKEILDILEKPDDYVPEVVTLAGAEVERRGGLAKVRLLGNAARDEERKLRQRAKAESRFRGALVLTFLLALIVTILFLTGVFFILDLMLPKGYSAPKWLINILVLVSISTFLLFWRLIIVVLGSRFDKGNPKVRDGGP